MPVKNSASVFLIDNIYCKTILSDSQDFKMGI